MSLTFQDALLALALTGGATTEPETSAPGGTLVHERLLLAGAPIHGACGLFRVTGNAPYRVKVLAPTDPSRLVRRFGAHAFVVADTAGVVWQVPLDGGPARVFDLGPDSRPQDVLLREPDAAHAYVSLRHDPVLKRLDLRTGALEDLVDLSPVGGGDAIALGTMERDGTRLFVQVKRIAPTPFAAEVFDTGVLAVLDLDTHTLIDVDPREAGTQGVALQGAPPRLPMQLMPASRTLFVSATEGLLDGRGAIERVDLDTLQSLGPVVSEETLADLGGFVMVSETTGYLVFHTDLAVSTHLMRFTLDGGPDPGPELLVFLGDAVDQLAHDPANGHVYLPTGVGGGEPVVWVLDVERNRVLPEPIAVGQPVGAVLPVSMP